MLNSLILRAIAPVLLGGVLTAPFVFVAHNNGYGSAMKEIEGQFKGYRQNELLLWSTISDVNGQGVEIAEKFEVVIEADDKARRAFRSELSTYIHQLNEGREQAKLALELIDHLKQTDDWAAKPVSPDIVCVRNDRNGCGDRPGTSEGDNDTGLLEPATDDADDL